MWTMKYPNSIKTGAERVCVRLSGTISRNTVPSMNPDPSAMK